MALTRTQRPFLGSEADTLLVQGLQDAQQAKADLRAALARIDPAPSVPSPNGRLLARMGSTAQRRSSVRAAVVDADENPMQNPTCKVDYDANRKVTRIVGHARVKRTLEQLAPILDPRSWSVGSGVIGAAFPVEDVDGEYKPRTNLNHLELGKPWKGLLYEYARSDVASFENILAIKEFTGKQRGMVKATYRLYDCLQCTFGSISAPGGLTVNQGHVIAKPDPTDSAWSFIEVLKVVKVRDLTPRDPGGRYDLGQWINSTIGAALSQWVDDTSMMSPIV